MIKALCHDADDKPMYIIGLSEGNLRLLREGRPIAFDMAEMGGEGRMMIFYGVTEKAMKRELARYMRLPEKE